MIGRCRAVLLIALLVWAMGVRAAGADKASLELQLFRVFLIDGTALASYGEWARVDDRVVFSMPVGDLASSPRLQLVNLPAARVDWPRTERYAESLRYLRYAATRGEDDFAALSAEIARVLNAVALSPTPERGLELAEQARRTLTEWPRQHYGYRQADVREILALLDEAISELRAATGKADFDLSLVVMAGAPAAERLLPPPTIAEQVQHLLGVARHTDVPADRLALLRTALGLMDRRGDALPAGHRSTWRANAVRAIADEVRIDREYGRMAQRAEATASRAAAEADVRRIERTLEEVRRGDARLGRRRSGQIQGLVARLQAQLDAARSLRLARDRWTMRAAAYHRYQRSLTPAVLSMSRVRAGLDQIRRLAGPDPGALRALATRLRDGLARLTLTQVPSELQAPHDLLLSAWHMASTAARLRHEAILGADLSRAREAATAAAGALLLIDRAQRELRILLEPPQPR